MRRGRPPGCSGPHYARKNEKNHLGEKPIFRGDSGDLSGGKSCFATGSTAAFTTRIGFDGHADVLRCTLDEPKMQDRCVQQNIARRETTRPAGQPAAVPAQF